MQFAILAQPESWYFRDLERAATARRHTTTRLDFAALAGTAEGCGQAGGGLGCCLLPDARDVQIIDPCLRDCPQFDALIVRTMPPGSLEQVVLRMDLLARLEAHGTRVVNAPKSLECAVDKYLTTARLAAAGLPVPETIATESADVALEAFQQLGGDVVIKPLFGSEGRGIVRVSDVEIASRVCRTLERIGAVIYLQRFIDHGGSDLRILVLGGRILGGMRRFSTGDFRTNVAQQGRAEPYCPSDKETELAVRAARVTGAAFAGVDLLTDRHGQTFVIEVNAVPGWQAFARVNQRDIANEFIAWLEVEQ